MRLHGHGAGPVNPCQFLHGNDVRGVIVSRPSVLLRPGYAQQPKLPHLAHDFIGEFSRFPEAIDLRADLLFDKVPDRAAKKPLLLVQIEKQFPHLPPRELPA